MTYLIFDASPWIFTVVLLIVPALSIELPYRLGQRVNRDQDEMWAIASGALGARPASLGLSLLMQSSNDTVDISAEQLQALTNHIPTPVVVLTVALITLGGLSLGIRFAAHGSRPLLLSAIFIVANVVVLNMMIDYDRPQTGLVRINLNPIKVQLQTMQRPATTK